MRRGAPGWLALALPILLLAAGGASAQVSDEGLVEAYPHVQLMLIEAEGDAGWTVWQDVAFAGSGAAERTMADFWLPPGAESLTLDLFSDTPRATWWYREGPATGRLLWDGGDGSAPAPAGFRVTFTLPDELEPFVAPAPVANATLRYMLLPGTPPPPVPGLEHRPTGGARDVYVAFTGPLEEGAVVALGAEEPVPAAGPGVLLTLAGSSVLVFLAGAAWTRARVRPSPPEVEMGLLDHLRELQARLLGPLVAFALLNVFFFAFDVRWARLLGGLALPVPAFSITESIGARVFQALAERLVPEGVQLIVVRPMDAVMAEILVTVFLAFLVVLPLLTYQVGSFLGPALYPDEKRFALRLVPLVTGLFVAGAAFAFGLLIPLMLRTLYEYAVAVGAAPLLNVPELVSFATVVTLVFGLAFQVPVVMAALARFGVVQPETFASKWRHAVVAIFLVAAVVTPDPSVVNQIVVAIPLLALYFFGVVAARAASHRAAAEAEAASAS